MNLTVGGVLHDSKMAEQIELEIESINLGVQRYRRLAAEAEKRGDAASLKPIERLLVYWCKRSTWRRMQSRQARLVPDVRSAVRSLPPAQRRVQQS